MRGAVAELEQGVGMRLLVRPGQQHLDLPGLKTQRAQIGAGKLPLNHLMANTLQPGNKKNIELVVYISEDIELYNSGEFLYMMNVKKKKKSRADVHHHSMLSIVIKNECHDLNL